MFFRTLLLLPVLASAQVFDSKPVRYFLKANTFDNTVGVCVAVAVSRNVLLTTADCVTASHQKSLLNTTQIVFGTGNPASDISSISGDPGSLTSLYSTGGYSPSKVMAHENYNPLTKSDNIALMFIDGAGVSTFYKIPSTIPGENVRVGAGGYGQLTSSGTTPAASFVSGELTILSQSACGKLWTPYKDNGDRIVCASSSSDFCNMDGVMFGIDRTTKTQYLIGLGNFIGSPGQSTGGSCKVKKSAIFFTLPQFYADWIFQNAGLAKASFYTTSPISLPAESQTSSVTKSAPATTSSPVEVKKNITSSSNSPKSTKLTGVFVHLFVVLVSSLILAHRL
ncbi:hypothetical protein AX774_g3474 [Zancudomyces culisetae]|uniref:Peptidase S1 domain-containing protein n=1 Tax=Zancudomyces culisetae TaxID=1213189 RepID=A0A1R1PQ07_ZANCU|nr:hypothetical protein AX774_g3474 [Zancudomyces culisetae]|eukprot:OMH83021.1 hypothetical protein AX774_g3474 [Zancudomyces culisetae]